ncbi:hypothetical protein [Deminuibacter soli]|uniref:Uncharacterized protein n=1 Tax=Deminuibacter soli TaxID=2291815 RepID=A0A3E1NHV5_9BACT|nr:hypothetical protein [Deminuibacter soli]RFM27499.1 hypothetical protein DXN05_15935 [Deminuibacter soli]
MPHKVFTRYYDEGCNLLASAATCLQSNNLPVAGLLLHHANLLFYNSLLASFFNYPQSSLNITTLREHVMAYIPNMPNVFANERETFYYLCSTRCCKLKSGEDSSMVLWLNGFIVTVPSIW